MLNRSHLTLPSSNSFIALSQCSFHRYFRDYTWTLKSSPEMNVTEQIVHCRCPKNSVTYLIRREPLQTGPVGYTYLFACSPQSVSIYSKIFCLVRHRNFKTKEKKWLNSSLFHRGCDVNVKNHVNYLRFENGKSFWTKWIQIHCANAQEIIDVHDIIRTLEYC